MDNTKEYKWFCIIIYNILISESLSDIVIIFYGKSGTGTTILCILSTIRRDLLNTWYESIISNYYCLIKVRVYGNKESQYTFSFFIFFI